MTATFPPVPGAEVFVFDQASPATVWTIDHNLGRPPAGLTIFDFGGARVTGAVTNPTDNQTVVTFSAAFGGRAVYA